MTSDVVFWIVASVGATVILTKGSIFAWLQAFGKPFDCPMCTGFWVGLAAFVGHGLVVGHFQKILVVMPFVTSLLSWVTAAIVELIEAATWRLLKEETTPSPPPDQE